jgi:hypothetical protein
MKKSSIYAKHAAMAVLALSAAGMVAPLRAQSASFTENNKSIAQLGAEGSEHYVSFVEPFGQDCQGGNAYVAPDRMGLYAQLLTAKISGTRLSRVDYTQSKGKGSRCSLEQVEFSEE